MKSKINNLLRLIVTEENMLTALEHVKKNKGAAGVDKMTVDELPLYFIHHFEELKKSILNGTYRPSPLKRVDILKDAEQKTFRTLTIPTVKDRMVQQAIHQVLAPYYEPDIGYENNSFPIFSDFSYGFRNDRNCHQAIKKALAYANDGYEIVADLDIRAFFDNVNHDKMIRILYRKTKDRRLLLLIEKLMQYDISFKGTITHNTTGVGISQGGPLSPLLANIYLTPLDKKLEAKKIRFIRYADDCILFFHSYDEMYRTLYFVRSFLKEELSLELNMEKTSCARIINAKYLGFGFYKDKTGIIHLKVHKKSIQKMYNKLLKLTGKQSKKIRRWSLDRRKEELTIYIRGWINYYQLTENGRQIVHADKFLQKRYNQLLQTRNLSISELHEKFDLPFFRFLKKEISSPNISEEQKFVFSKELSRGYGSY